MSEKFTLMSPKVDFVFKKIFGNPEMPEVLISFLNAVLNNNNSNKIKSVIIQNPIIDKDAIDDKYSILDVRAVADDDTIIDIEIQVADKNDMVKRTVYYLSKLIEEQIFEGDDYTKLIKSVTINIVDFIVVQNDKVHNSFMFKETETNELLTDVAQIHFLEMPKLLKNGIVSNELLKDWLLFIENPEAQEVTMIAEQVPEIKKAINKLNYLSQSQEERNLYNQRQKSLHERVSSLNYANRQAKQEVLCRLMSRKFQMTDKELELINKCDNTAKLDAALDEVLFADSKEAVLEKLV